MTKDEFINHKEPLVMIVSFNPKTGKSLWDTYEPATADSWKEDFERDFPDCLHFTYTNTAGIAERKERLFGIKPKKEGKEDE